jgi:hypothetical protein
MVAMAAEAELAEPASSHAPDVGAPIREPDISAHPEPRGALRAARRHRRQVMVVCALVIAVCLVLTILIVNIARGRRPDSGVAVPDVVLVRMTTAPGTLASASPLVLTPPTVNPDAAASEGEHR